MSILLFGGTTEGRVAVRVLDAAGSPFWYSTIDNRQKIESHNGHRLTGVMRGEDIRNFCLTHDIALIIDAAHPFASTLHSNIAEVAQELSLPVVRYERIFPERDEEIFWANDYDEAVALMRREGVSCLLALTGVKTISKLRTWWGEEKRGAEALCGATGGAVGEEKRGRCRTIFRILRREESLSIVRSEGFPEENLCFFEDGESVEELIERFGADAIITKESGESGLFNEKVEAARRAGVKIFAVKCPPMPTSFITVYGESGLRYRVERLCEGFFPLKTGFTSGLCATLATKAALRHLLTGCEVEREIVTLPSGEPIEGPVKFLRKEGDAVSYGVVKDSGDDPDVMNGRLISAMVRLSKESGVHFLRGEGVGVVTLAGLGLPIGEPAINKAPREMMERAIRELLPQGGIDVTISVEGGEELALKTFNPKLGVEGGLSIIGTSGIVKPFSAEAFVETVRREVRVASALGIERLIFNSGAKSERIMRERFPDTPPQGFIHYGNFIGEVLRVASEEGVRECVVGVMIGKAVKIAAGSLNTYSRDVLVDREFLSRIAMELGLDPAPIAEMHLARELWNIYADSPEFFQMIAKKCLETCKSLSGEMEIELLLISENGEIIFLKK